MFEFNKKEANFIKGIAILLMFYHHLFGFKSWIDLNLTFFELSIGNTSLESVLASFKKYMCLYIYSHLDTHYQIMRQRVGVKQLAKSLSF